jgi:F-type H+-transporting ATPase subunit alpha
MKNFSEYLETTGEYGVVKELKASLVKASGIPKAKLHELILFESGKLGEVFSANRDVIEILTFSKEPVAIGERMVRTDTTISVPVGESLLGTIIDPLGTAYPIVKDFKKPTEEREIYAEAGKIDVRAAINKPLLTGVCIVDLLVPLGMGQKELVIGDRKTGKTSFVLTTMVNQIKNNNCIVIYAGIARKTHEIKRLYEYFQTENIMDKVIIVASNSQDSPSLIYLTPYSAMTIAEYFRDQGQDVLVILDDLSTHAKFYREISLVGKRFPGRDSYPGDIFYAHAQLLERTGNFTHKEKGAVAISCLPIVEIVEGDLASYIATNVMGMTDGHILFDNSAFHNGRRPAINPSVSVTRVGKQAQSHLRREISQTLTAFLAEYEKMQNYSYFGAELSDKVKDLLKTGDKLYRLFNQSYKLMVPEKVQTLLFMLIWIKTFNEYTNDQIESAIVQLTQTAQEGKLDSVFKLLEKIETMDELEKMVVAQKNKLIGLCKV